MKKNPQELSYKSGFWISSLLCVHLFAIFGLLFSDSSMRRVLYRLGYVFRRPKLWPGPSGEKLQENFKTQLVDAAYDNPLKAISIGIALISAILGLIALWK